MGHMTSTNERSLLTWAAAHLEVVRSFAGSRIGGVALPRRQLHREPRACPQSHDAHVGRHVPLVNVLSPTAVHMVTRNHRKIRMVRRQLHREPRAWPQSHDAHVGRHVPHVNHDTTCLRSTQTSGFAIKEALTPVAIVCPPRACPLSPHLDLPHAEVVAEVAAEQHGEQERSA